MFRTVERSLECTPNIHNTPNVIEVLGEPKLSQAPQWDCHSYCVPGDRANPLNKSLSFSCHQLVSSHCVCLTKQQCLSIAHLSQCTCSFCT